MYSRPYIAYATLPLSLCAGFSVYAQQPEPAIENIQVLGRAQQYYLDTSTRVGTKTDADVMQIPLSVQVLSRQLINDQAARDITDMYRSIAGPAPAYLAHTNWNGFASGRHGFD